jgi:DNA-nicking Smr family endonuclease
MAKKKPPKTDRADEAPKLPTFSGFKPLAAGLGDLKAKLDEQKKRDEREGKPPPPPPPPQKAPARPNPKPVSESAKDDELTFHRMMSGVTPLEGGSQRVSVSRDARSVEARISPVELRERARKEAAEVLEHLHQLVDDGVRFEVTDDGKRVEGRRLDVSPGVVRELRRGAVPIDSRLDLHGFGASAAQAKLLEFLRAMRTRGERCVLVIHGKGEHSDLATGGVLRGEIAAWLSQGRAREHVAAFTTAHPEDGGEGAVYVALRP